MRTALLYQDGNFVGREYFAALAAADLVPQFVVPVGRMRAESLAIEQERVDGRWNPAAIPESAITRRFETLNDPDLPALLKSEKIDIAIQGGIGILKGEVLSAPTIGWLNVHPGKLPEYRGNACPEWAILNDDTVVATAHLIDEGIDTGPIVCAADYEIDPSWTYHEFRANLYRHCARVLTDALRKLGGGASVADILRPQTDKNARYWPLLGAAEREAVRARFPRVAIPVGRAI